MDGYSFCVSIGWFGHSDRLLSLTTCAYQSFCTRRHDTTGFENGLFRWVGGTEPAGAGGIIGWYNEHEKQSQTLSVLSSENEQCIYPGVLGDCLQRWLQRQRQWLEPGTRVVRLRAVLGRVWQDYEWNSSGVGTERTSGCARR